MEENVNEKATKRKRQKIHEFDLSQDIHYRGPLSYRSFKILGWICLAISQLVLLLSLISRVAPAEMAPSTSTLLALSFFGSLAIPFLLFGNFARILNNRYVFKRLMMVHGFAALGIIALSLFIYFHYLLGLSNVVFMTRQEFAATLQHFFSANIRGGIWSFNIFIDLLLCTLFMFFLTYEPKLLFTEKKLLVFRLFALFPILYEVTSLVLKFLANFNIIELPLPLLPFLTTKPPMMFIVFIVLALYVKMRERQFLKNGRTMDEYRQFLHTKKNSWNVSVFAAILFLVAGVLDFIIVIILVGTRVPVADILAASGTTNSAVQGILRLGFGGSTALIPMAPLMLLFSYNRTHKNSVIDVIIPICGIALIALVYMEVSYQVILQIPSMLGL